MDDESESEKHEKPKGEKPKNESEADIMTDKDMDKMTDMMNELFKTMKTFTDNFKATARQMDKRMKERKARM